MARREYERLTTLSIDQGLALIRLGMTGRSTHRILGEKVSISSLRLRTFLFKGIHCHHKDCPLCGEFFAVERTPISPNRDQRYFHPQYGQYHLNLWSVDGMGNEVLFTHDHIIARALGGEDNMANSVTMCKHHNQVKSRLEARVSEILQKEKENTLESGIIYAEPVLGKKARRTLRKLLEGKVYGEPVLATV